MLTKTRERQIKDKACTVCDGLRPYGKGFRAVSKIRCDTCENGSNWKLERSKIREVIRRIEKNKPKPIRIW